MLIGLKQAWDEPDTHIYIAFKTQNNGGGRGATLLDNTGHHHVLLFCSSSLVCSAEIFSLSTWSRRTLAHFCRDSMMLQGRDMSTTNRARLSASVWAVTANFSRPLWYRSPSRIHTLHRVGSADITQQRIRLLKHTDILILRLIVIE